VVEGIREILPLSLHIAHNGPGMHGLGYWSASEIPIAIDGKFAIVYLPSPRSIAIDIKQFASGYIVARWFDPATGQFLDSAFRTQPGSGHREFTVPDCSRDGDWVLLLSAVAT
jgi:Putative collagen-binding domain of a collagenase